ncbi:transposase, partial [Nonomuraea sp. NPDC048892]|uniref:transposase n=1 Tax=Nonomuraea sp. NPDC048892 TaxID=3154624 RepID=UPI0033C389D2
MRSSPALPSTKRQVEFSQLHYLRNFLTCVNKSSQPFVATLVRTIFDQPDAASVRTQHAWVVQTLEAKHPAAAEHLDAAREDLIAFAVKVRDNHSVQAEPAYLAVGIDADGDKHVLGIWLAKTPLDAATAGESARFWTTVMNDLRNRGVRDILIACTDALADFSASTWGQ